MAHRGTDSVHATDDKCQQARDLAAAGKTVDDIALETGLTSYYVALLLEMDCGVPLHDGRGIPLSPTRRAEIIAAIRSGYSNPQITQICHCSETTVYKLRCQLRQCNSTALLPFMAQEDGSPGQTH